MGVQWENEKILAFKNRNYAVSFQMERPGYQNKKKKWDKARLLIYSTAS